MELETPSNKGLFDLVDWLDKNKRVIGWCVGGLAALVLAYAFLGWRATARETQASEALSNLRPVPNAAGVLLPIAADDYVLIANQYAGTQAGGRALLLGASGLFADGKYDQAHSSFDRFLREFPESPVVPQALLGVAACLDAQGKQAEAFARYQSLAERHAHAPTVMAARAAMARLYEAQNKPQDALRLYQELARNETGGSYALEAGIRAEDLLVRNPALRTNAPAASIP